MSRIISSVISPVGLAPMASERSNNNPGARTARRIGGGATGHALLRGPLLGVLPLSDVEASNLYGPPGGSRV